MSECRRWLRQLQAFISTLSRDIESLRRLHSSTGADVEQQWGDLLRIAAEKLQTVVDAAAEEVSIATPCKSRKIRNINVHAGMH